jgi:hypothetical protein
MKQAILVYSYWYQSIRDLGTGHSEGNIDSLTRFHKLFKDRIMDHGKIVCYQTLSASRDIRSLRLVVPLWILNTVEVHKDMPS